MAPAGKGSGTLHPLGKSATAYTAHAKASQRALRVTQAGGGGTGRAVTPFTKRKCAAAAAVCAYHLKNPAVICADDEPRAASVLYV